MLSSSSIIKNKCVELEGNVKIDTHYIADKKIPKESHSKELSSSSFEGNGQHDGKNHEEMFKKLGQTVIKNAQEKSQKIMSEANHQAEILKKNAYDEGYKTGYKTGYDEGYSKAYKEAIDKAISEKQKLVQEGECILNSCKEEYEKYFQHHEKEILECIVNIARQVIHMEVGNKGAIVTMIEEELEKISQSKTVIIKANPVYSEEIKSNIEKWKLEYVLDNVFFIPLESIEEGKVLIEKDNGKIRVDVDYALEKIRDELTK